MNFEFESVNFPGALATVVMGINDKGDIAGSYIGTNGKIHGFVRTHLGQWAPLDYPWTATLATAATGINNSGQVIGTYWTVEPLADPTSAFLYENGVFTSIVPPAPDPIDTIDAPGINNQGYIVGLLSLKPEDEGELDTGYVRFPDGRFWIPTLQEGPFGGHFEFTGINRRGDIVGFGSVGNYENSFLRRADGSYTIIIHPAVPGVSPIDTQVEGVNALGEMVGDWTPADTEAINGGHAFYRAVDGTITDFNYPGAVRTFAAKINASGMIVGFREQTAGDMLSW